MQQHNNWRARALLAMALAVAGVPALAQVSPPPTPAQAAFLRAESKKAVDRFVREVSAITGMSEDQIRKALPAEGRITDSGARVIAALEKQRGEPLSEEQRAGIVQADAEKKSAYFRARETARVK